MMSCRFPVHICFALVTTFAFSACGASFGFRPQPDACRAGDSALTRDVLYFGRSIPGGGSVSDEEWQTFLDGVVTSRFPNGLTVMEGRGQWKTEDGKISKERSEVIILLHPSEARPSRQIEEIVTEYKRRFRQESVLRESTATCAHF